MQNAISIFTFQAEQSVRVEIINDEAWFCLADVAAIMEIQNARQLKLNEKGVCKTYTPTTSGKQLLTFINEPNLYRVIFRSNKPEAVKFQDWIFEEVIPQIRKTGKYETSGSLKLTPEQKQQIREAVKVRSFKTGEHFQAIYEKLHSFCKVNSYHEILASDFQAAMQFLASIENAPKPATATIDNELMLSIGRVLLHAQDMRLFVNRYLPAFENLGIDNKGALWSYVHDTEPAFARVRSAFLAATPECKHWSQDDASNWIRRRIIATAEI